MKKYFLVFCLLTTISCAVLAGSKGPSAEYVLAQIEKAKTDVEKLPLVLTLSFIYEDNDIEKFGLYAQKVIELATELNDDQTLAIGYSNKARYYSYRGDFEESINSYIVALKHAETIHDEYYIIGIRGSIGNTYFQLKQYAKAKEHFEYAANILESDEEKHNKFQIAAASHNLGAIHFELGEYEQAENRYNKALNIFKTHGYKEQIADGFLALGTLYIVSQKDVDKGLQYLIDAQEMHNEIEYPRNKIEILNSFAIYHSNRNEYDKALEYANQVITLSKEINAKDLKATGEKTLSDIYTELNEYEKALKTRESYESAKDSMLDESTIAKIVELEAQLITQDKEEQISKLDDELGESATRQKYTALLGLITISITFLIIWFIYQQKRTLGKRFISINEENEILKQTNFSLKERMLIVADKIEHAKSSQSELRSEKYHSSSFKKEDKQEYMNALLDIMEQKKLFLHTDLKLNELANSISLSSHQLSELLNETIGKNFNEFVNTYRIEEAKTIMHRSDAHNKKLLTIAYESGFNSKPSFNRAFKAITGTSPSAYKKRLAQQVTNKPNHEQTV